MAKGGRMREIVLMTELGDIVVLSYSPIPSWLSFSLFFEGLEYLGEL
jgi:hypothetical protein